jgi:TRAP-type C4-dicarboxylate transport system permease small subunit
MAGAVSASSPPPDSWASRVLIHGLVEIVGGAAIFGLMMLTVSDALLRSFANYPVLGANDFTQIILVVVVACSLPLCVAGGRTITIDLLIDLMPTSARAVVRRLAAASGTVMLGYLAWRCLANARDAATFGETTTLLQIPFGPFYLALAIGLALSALLFLADAIWGRQAP